ncbi:MAG: thioredoxin family protein [Chloroflexi bacterium]|nr:thioredoxin family protein [Chloroflexota bacterium]
MLFEITDNTFEQEVINTRGTNIIVFWSPDCGHCRILTPLIEKLSEYETFKGKLRFYRINIEENTRIADSYKVEVIPVLLFFKDGKKIGESRGAVSEELLMNKLDILVNG